MRILSFLALLLTLCVAGCESEGVSSTLQISSSSSAQYKETTFDDLKFEMLIDTPFRRELLTPQIEQLFGKKIRIRGYMYPTLKRRGLTGFVLVRDNQQCCFGPGAALYDCMRVEMQPETTAEFSVRPIAVEGQLRYEPFTDPDGTTRAIYYLESAAVLP